MEPKKLYCSRNSRMICGVCGGIAEYFNIDPTLIRLGFVLGACASFGAMLLGYFVAAVTIPDER